MYEERFIVWGYYQQVCCLRHVGTGVSAESTATESAASVRYSNQSGVSYDTND